MRHGQRLPSNGATRPRGHQAPRDGAPERSLSLQKRLKLPLLLLLLLLQLLLRVRLSVFETCDPCRDRVVARPQLLQHLHNCRIDWCCGKAQAGACGSALADASVRCSGARRANSFPLLASYIYRGGLTSHYIQRGVLTSLLEGRLVDHAQKVKVDLLSGRATHEICYEFLLLPPLSSTPKGLALLTRWFRQ